MTWPRRGCEVAMAARTMRTVPGRPPDPRGGNGRIRRDAAQPGAERRGLPGIGARHGPRHGRGLPAGQENARPGPPRGRVRHRRGAELLPVEHRPGTRRRCPRRRDRRDPDRGGSDRRHRARGLGRARAGAGARLRRRSGVRGDGRDEQ